MIGRREFIAGLGSAAAWPVVARAQQPAMPVVGYLDTNQPTWLPAFRKGLSETGFVDGRNVTIQYRSVPLNTVNRLDRLRELAADLASRASVIVAPNSALAHLVKATATVPIVFRTGFDPVQDGLVESFDRPGGQITGITDISVALGRKRLQLLHDMLPGASRFGALVNDPNRPFTEVRSSSGGLSRLSPRTPTAKSTKRLQVCSKGASMPFWSIVTGCSLNVACKW